MPALTPLLSLIPGVGVDWSLINSDTEPSGSDMWIWFYFFIPVIGIILMNLNVKGLKVLSKIFKVIGGIILTFYLLVPIGFLIKRSWRFAAPIIPILTLIAGIAGIILLAIKKKSAD